jgi:NitT/TauT family transport system permease protein
MTDRTPAAALPAEPVVNRSPGINLDRLTSILYPLVTFAVLLALWEGAVTAFEVPSYLFPRIVPVLNELYDGYVGGAMLPHLVYTLQSTVYGYIIGCGSAILLGAALAESRTAEKFLFPFVVALQSTPKVAVAPLIIIWAGYGLASKVIMVAMICFFPLFVNTVTGIRQTDPAMINMMRAFSAPNWLIFFRVKLFAAAGHIFAGLQIAVVLALIGAVVSEFVASSEGLGFLIQSAMANFNTSTMFASIISLIGLGLIGTSLVRFAHRRVVFWDRSKLGASGH